MQQRHLSPLKVSALALGYMGMTYGYGEVHDKKQMVKLTHKGLELGINFFDTAEAYGEDNEELLGEAIKPFRDKVVVASKFGIYYANPNDKYASIFLDSSPSRIKSTIEGSLKRLKIECIDSYY